MSIPDNLIIRYYANGIVSEIYEFDKDGDRHGYNMCWGIYGQKRREFYMDHGVLNGPRTSFRDDGTKWEEAYYRNGHRHGSFRTWHTNGQMYEKCLFNCGDMHGLYQMWDENGKLLEVVYYFNDDDITEEIKEMVNDITCITEEEKTQIALQYGIVL